ncbi:glycosyltransferase family 2 protein [Propionimicrobium lymphophilum]|uniref:glycosyltransferase family 2 protein n=1 Tax=Propionimicrobium lymphophilum TaxID=33012 RepID=UPI00288A1989|nr:glycosyltransferase family 2 protein [Propionimicrobium lymphophilum]
MNPAISVLVPIYNVQDYLHECLGSLAAQDMSDVEFICINDGSKDGSRDIIQEFLDKDSRFTVIDKENSGYGASMNRGLEKAKGEFIAILESDDFMEPYALSTLHKAITESGADVVKANFWMYWSTPTERNEFFEAIPANKAGRLIDTSVDHGIFHAKPSIWSAMYRKSFLDKNQIRFLETPGASFQDTSFTFKVWASADKVYFVHKPLVHYRQDNENSSVNSPAKVDALFNEYSEITRWLSENKKKSEIFSPVKVKMLYDALIWNYERVAEENKVLVLEKGRDMFLDEFKAGHVDIRLFEPWKLQDLRTILLNPRDYHDWRVKPEALSHKVGRLIQDRGFVGLTKTAANKAYKKAKGLAKSWR